MYNHTQDETFKNLAIKYTTKMAAQANNTGMSRCQIRSVGTHDLGFMVGYPFIAAYKNTGMLLGPPSLLRR